MQEANCCASWLMCCVKCCIWCLEKIVAFINKNAYIMIGLKGSNYCSAAGRAIQLLISVRGLERLKHCHTAAPPPGPLAFLSP